MLGGPRRGAQAAVAFDLLVPDQRGRVPVVAPVVSIVVAAHLRKRLGRNQGIGGFDGVEQEIGGLRRRMQTRHPVQHPFHEKLILHLYLLVAEQGLDRLFLVGAEGLVLPPKLLLGLVEQCLGTDNLQAVLVARVPGPVPPPFLPDLGERQIGQILLDWQLRIGWRKLVLHLPEQQPLVLRLLRRFIIIVVLEIVGVRIVHARPDLDEDLGFAMLVDQIV